MERQQIRVDLAVSAAMLGMPSAQRLGMKGRWVVKAHRPSDDDLPKYIELRRERMLARGEACAALRNTGRELVGAEVVVRQPRRFMRHQLACSLMRRSDAAAAPLARLADLDRQFADFPRIEKWADTIDNIVVNAGLNHLLDVTLSGGSQITTWYLGLISPTPTVAAGDTMASHAGWTEVVAYDEAVRQTFVEAGASGQSLSNTASPAVFTISTNGTNIGGAFLNSVSTKSGTTGTLYAAGAFTAGNKDLDDNDTLSVTLTATAAAA